MRTIFTFAFAFALTFTSTASELFIRVNAPKEHFVAVQTQTHYNSNNVFKFFDLQSGYVTVQVVNRFNNAVLYNGNILLKNNERVVAQIDGWGKLTIIQKIRIQEVNWYTTYTDNDEYSGNPYPGGPYPGNPYPGNPYPGGQNPNDDYYSGNVVSTSIYQKFLTSFRNESMDNNRLTMANSFVKSNTLTAEQIAGICKEFSFDNNRLEFAKTAYSKCYDKSNYFLLKDSFSFSSNYNSLLKYIETL
jgi:hypothetical protein